MTAALATRFATLGAVVALVVAACGGSSSEESSRQNPAGIDEPVSTTITTADGEFDVRITLHQALRGLPALASILEADSRNSGPAQGFEYVLALVTFEYLRGPDENTQFFLSSFDFTAVSSDGKDYLEPVFAIEPEPRIVANLYPGASHEGWLILQVEQGDAAPLMAFGRDELGRGGAWWRLPVLEPPP